MKSNRILSLLLASLLACAPLSSLAESTAQQTDAVTSATQQTQKQSGAAQKGTKGRQKNAAPAADPAQASDGAEQNQIAPAAKGNRNFERKKPAAANTSAYKAFVQTLLEKGVIDQVAYDRIIAYLDGSAAAQPASDTAGA